MKIRWRLKDDVKKWAAAPTLPAPMPAKEPAAPLHNDKKATEHLANERTFLAWVRTSIAIISLGFVVAKFSLWLSELAVRFDPQARSSHSGASLPIGIAMMVIGAVFAGLAARRYHKVTHDIERGVVGADRGLVLFVTIAVVVLAAVMIIFMVLSAGKI
jgi:putative membrane protein